MLRCIHAKRTILDPILLYSKTAAPRRSSKTENVERSERTGRARETRHPSPPPATAGPHRLRRDWCLAHRLIRWTDPRTLLRATACYPVALPVLGANLCCLLRLPVNIVFIVFKTTEFALTRFVLEPPKKAQQHTTLTFPRLTFAHGQRLKLRLICGHSFGFSPF